MSLALRVGLFVASLAVITPAIRVIYVSFEARSHVKQFLASAEQVKADLEVLTRQSHELISNATEVSRRVSEQLDQVETVVRTVRQWADRADRIVESVGSAIEPPIFTPVRNVNIFRKGASAFLQALLHFDKHNRHNANSQQEGEDGHV